ncbi:MAG: hypothetical protein PVI26_04350 [Chitinispirillia bacterium]
MFLLGIVPTHIDSVRWQDYRNSNSGMVVYYNTDPVSEIPIREIPEEIPSDIAPEPNYETSSYGFYGCKHTKIRSSFLKTKLGYLFFMTRYAGTNTEFSDELMITGYYRIKKFIDVQKLHIRYLNEYSCINEDTCTALRADEVHFVSVEDGFKLSPEILSSWGCKSRITRQSKLILDDKETLDLVNYFKSKDNALELYIKETERLQPEIDDEDDNE